MRSSLLISVAVATAAATLLAGCSSVRNSFGLGKSSPDEFRVVTQAPLSMPPDYNLRPPRPGAPRPQEATASTIARSTLIGSDAGATAGPILGSPGTTGSTAPFPAPAAGVQSSAEAALLQQAGAANPDPSIRGTVDQETAQLAAADRTFVDRLIFWRQPEPSGTVVDPAAESQRLKENAALGLPPTEGPTPTITRRKRALLEGVF
jgi:hypothetical protein